MNHVVKTDAVLTREALKVITRLQDEDNEGITSLCRECELIARWFLQHRTFLSEDIITSKEILDFYDMLDAVRDILTSLMAKEEAANVAP